MTIWAFVTISEELMPLGAWSDKAIHALAAECPEVIVFYAEVVMSGNLETTELVAI